MTADLLDLLAQVEDTGPDVLHALMPWMGAACGTVQACGGGCRGGCPPQSKRHRFTVEYSKVDCPACLAAGDLGELARASQARMAKVEE